jgi:hypothetical protein
MPRSPRSRSVNLASVRVHRCLPSDSATTLVRRGLPLRRHRTGYILFAGLASLRGYHVS